MPDVGHIPASDFNALLEVCRLLTVTSDIDLLFRRIAEAVTSILRCERASIFLFDAATDELWTKVALQSDEIRVPAGVGIVGHSFKQNRIINVADAYSDARFNPEPDHHSGLTRNLLSVPMLDLTAAPVGVVQALNKDSPFDERDELMLQLLANQAAVAFQRGQLQLEAVRAAYLQREMELAKTVQVGLIPKTPLVLPWAECDGWTQSADLTGGDCFNFWPAGDGRLGIFMGDASGHGLAPAMIIAQVATLVRALSDFEFDPFRILSKVNARLWNDLEAGRFVTAFLGFLSYDGQLEWFSAGQGPIFFRRSGCSPLELIHAPAPPLAVTEAFVGSGVMRTQLETGGTISMISDGILDAFDGRHQLFGSERVVWLMDEMRNRLPGEVISAVREAVQTWQGSKSPADDQSILVVRRI
ncbi:MAG: SpoIIE family protein phosphatase [Planctomycetota bacterium]|nr:SpoIIE family protein phosphatase [Planctomycetota bacterium]